MSHPAPACRLAAGTVCSRQTPDNVSSGGADWGPRRRTRSARARGQEPGGAASAPDLGGPPWTRVSSPRSGSRGGEVASVSGQKAPGGKEACAPAADGPRGGDAPARSAASGRASEAPAPEALPGPCVARPAAKTAGYLRSPAAHPSRAGPFQMPRERGTRCPRAPTLSRAPLSHGQLRSRLLLGDGGRSRFHRFCAAPSRVWRPLFLSRVNGKQASRKAGLLPFSREPPPLTGGVWCGASSS